ncbi:MAG: type IX secretion system membrane protein PorP/SprF [Bacteroidales bacterium]|nr:type IX secretion system membrane protein PorP/SprF [Bacteroidales bacterium]MCU0407832.1 type IX secretion system membrane protein PorP/SprF [Bacteroidales bacterium]
MSYILPYNISYKLLIKAFWALAALLLLAPAKSQDNSFNPFPFWVYSPYIYNPAMTGTKDFVSVDLNGLFLGSINTQVAGGSARFSRTSSGYYNSPDILEFRNAGIGGSVVHGSQGPSRNIGADFSASYQIPLSTRNLTFLSFGASGKAMYNIFDSLAAGTGSLQSKKMYTDMNAGVYLYGASFFTGISALNILGNYSMPDSLGAYGIASSRQYLFTAGYKIVLSRQMNIVLEPSIVAVANDSTISTAWKYIYPVLKLYVENFCLGSYYRDEGNLSFFFQYRFPSLYIGSYFELPRKSPYFKSDPLIEVTIGLNLQKDKKRLSGKGHW